MANRNYRKPGAHYNVICDSCGFKFKDNELKLRWDGFYTCAPCWTPRQPQDLIKAPTEDLRLPYVRPRPNDVFVPSSFARVNLEYLTLVDKISTMLVFNRNLSDTITITDLLGTKVNPGFNDSNTIADSLSRIWTANRTLSDTSTITDSFIFSIGDLKAINGNSIDSTTIG